jgi:septum formation protein
MMSPMPLPQCSLYRNLQPLVLASASPRRLELLRMVGLEFEVIPSGHEEAALFEDAPRMLVERWAVEKALIVAEMRPDAWVLAADTIVVLDGTIFGKPVDSAEAEEMLGKLCGRVHEVITAIALVHKGRESRRVQSVETVVHFRNLHRGELKAYVESGEPMDKAGSYGIQGIGAFLVRAIQGSYTNVVGLPLSETLEWLLECKIIEVERG